MNDPGTLVTNQSQIDSRENLFYFLQSLTKRAWPDGDKSSEFSPASEQIEKCAGQNGMV